MVAQLLLSIYLFSLPSFSPQTFPDPIGDISDSEKLLVTINGDIWMFQFDNLTEKNFSEGNWTRLSNDLADDRNPIWRQENESLIFSSNREGTYDLWELDIESKKTTRLTNSNKNDTQPSLSSKGDLVWVRGMGADANLWIKENNQSERKLTKTLGGEHSPSFSPNGQSLAYISENSGHKELRILDIKSKKTRPVISDLEAEYPVWSPIDDRIVFSARGGQKGVYITNTKGEYSNLISQQRARAIWSAGSKGLILSEIPRKSPSYNGDPLTPQPRFEDVSFPKFYFISTPPIPDQLLVEISTKKSSFSSKDGLKEFDQTASYLNERYKLDQSEFAQDWQKIQTQLRKKAAKASTSIEAESVIYELIKKRPYLNPEKKGKAGVSSAHPLATAAGVEILNKGGNVVDAAVAVSFALGVVEPDASGLGGYGEMLIYLKEMEAPTCIEFLTRVPEAGSLDNGKLQNLPNYGPKLVNIPGTVAGMELAWKKYGSKKVSWKEIVTPAQRIAEKGFVLDESFTTTLQREKEKYLQYESNKKRFFPNGNPLMPGDTLKNPDLAWVLKTIAEKGGSSFYKGEIAKRMVKDLNSHGNVMTLNDMARYYAVEREPVKTTYRGNTVYSGPPPVSGGASLIGKLNLLENSKKDNLYQDDPNSVHAMIEAWKMAPSGWGKVADPGLWPVNMEPFTNKAKAKEEWLSCFNPDQSISPKDYDCYDQLFTAADIKRKGLDKKTLTGTTAFVVADGDGNMVSVTQTLGTWGGNFYITPGLGFLYNDKLLSYSTNPNSFNARIPFARNVTSISPSLVFKGMNEDSEPWFAVGAAGNAWINAAVYEMIVAMIDQELGPQEAIELPRFLVNARRNRGEISEIVVQVEDGFAPEVLSKLKEMGHEIQIISRRGELRMGYASAILIDGKMIRAGADPRRSGKAGVVK